MQAAISLLPPAVSLLLYALRLREMATDRQVVPGQIREKGTLRMFIAVGTFVLVGSLAEFYLLRHRIPVWPLFAMGLVSGVASIVIRRRAIAALGRYWSLHVEIRESHVFVRSGPYRRIRHPVYLSMLMELISVPLICHAYLTLALMPVFFIPVLLRRISLEEAALLEKFGEAYREYMRATAAVLPGIW